MRNQRPELSNHVLDALTESIALLDASGVIIGVNEAWRRFAASNAGDCRTSYIGQNYLEVCARAVASGCDADAVAVHCGLRAMLNEQLPSFSIEYPCHAPHEQRWFIVQITRCTTPDAGALLVVAHLDITARKLAELALEQMEEQLEQSNAELTQTLARERRAARCDELTGIANRRHFFATGTRLVEIARRYRQPLAVVMLDLDHFKQINDGQGHQAGDRMLRHLAGIGIDQLRTTDLLARYGGDEFAILLPGTDGNSALNSAKRICNTLAAEPIPNEPVPIQATLSAGITEFRDGDTLDTLIARADRALYAAKRGGRNRCVLDRAGTLTAQS